MKLLAAILLSASLQSAEYAFKTSDGVSLRVVDEGKGRPLVFVPGWTMTAEIWKPQFKRYRKKYRVISYDPRGQGKSPCKGKEQGTARRARDLEEILLHSGLKRPVVVGWSMGALELLHCLAHGKAELGAVVFLDQGLDKECWGGPVPGPKLSVQVEEGPYPKVIKDFVEDMFETKRSRRELEAITHLSLKTPQKNALASLLGASTGAGLPAALRERPMPALSMVTSRLFKEADCLEKAVPRLQIERFEKAGHALFIDEPGRFHSILDQFLAGLR